MVRMTCLGQIIDRHSLRKHSLAVGMLNLLILDFELSSDDLAPGHGVCGECFEWMQSSGQ